MDLHRARKIADWELAPAHARNRWQRLAARTRGIITPGNIMTICGGALVGFGLFAVQRDALGQGLIAVIIGRWADVFDGRIAQRTHTKSRLGEILDASADKVAIAGALIIFVLQHIIPLWVGIIVGVRSVANVVLAAIAQAKGQPLHPSKTGKLSTATEWLALGVFIAAKLAYNHHARTLGISLRCCAVVLLTVALVFGYQVSAIYARKILQYKR